MSAERDEDHYAWLVRARTQNQELLLRLFQFGEMNALVFQHEERRGAIFGLLVGAAFSLWRSAFLCDTNRTSAAITKDAIELLRTLLRDNAVNYTQDRKTREWMGGYYLNSARFRLMKARAKVGKLNLIPHAEFDAALKPLVDLDAQGITESEPTSAWNVLHDALVTMLDFLESTSASDSEVNTTEEPPNSALLRSADAAG